MAKDEVYVVIKAKVVLPEGLTLQDLQDKCENEIVSLGFEDDEKTCIDLDTPTIEEDNE
jgi:hypothetical protein